MKDKTICYLCKQVPDPSRAVHRASAGGDVTGAIGGGIAAFLRTLSDCPPGETVASFRYVYVPTAQAQSRLSLEIFLKSDDKARLSILNTALKHGPLSAFYDFQDNPGRAFPWQALQAVCHSVRRCETVPSLTDPRDHPRAMQQFLVMRPFSSRKQGSFATFDKTLDALGTPCLVDITLTGVDMRDHLKNLARWGASVEELERPSADNSLDDVDDPVFYGMQRVRARPFHSMRARAPSRDPLASDVLRDIRALSQSLSGPCLAFTIRCFAVDEPTAKMIASGLSESCFEAGSFSLWTPTSQPDRIVQEIASAREVSPPVSVPLLESVFPAGVPSALASLGAIANIASVEELQGLRLLPIAGHSPPRTIRKDTSPPEVDPSELIVLGYDVGFEDGEIDFHLQPCRGIRLGDLLKHFLILGIPGTGKTSTCLNLVASLWTGWRIPSLVIECYKSEFRALLTLRKHLSPSLRDLGEATHVYSPGSDLPIAYRKNLFIKPEWMTVDQQVQSLNHVFAAGRALSGPMIPLLTEANFVMYERFEKLGYPPTLEDFIPIVEEVLRSKNYGAELTANILGALTARLTPLLFGETGRTLRTSVNLPDTASFFRAPHCLELNELLHDDICLTAMSVLEEVIQYAKRLPYTGERPKLHIVLDEAQAIAPQSRGTVASEDNPDPASFVAESLYHMLAVCRAYGIAVTISSQLVKNLDERIAKLPASSLIYCAKDGEERDWISSALLLGPTESDDLVRLPTGVAYFRTPRYDSACRIRTPNVKEEWNIAEPPQGNAILPYITESADFRETMDTRLRGEMDVFASRLGSFEEELSNSTKLLDSLAEQCVVLKKTTAKSASSEPLLRKLERTCAQVRANDVAIQKGLERLEKLFTQVVPARLPDILCSTSVEEEYRLVQGRWEQVRQSTKRRHEHIQEALVSAAAFIRPSKNI